MTFCWVNLRDAYNFNRDTVAYIYTYLKKQEALCQNKWYSKLRFKCYP